MWFLQRKNPQKQNHTTTISRTWHRAGSVWLTPSTLKHLFYLGLCYFIFLISNFTMKEMGCHLNLLWSTKSLKCNVGKQNSHWLLASVDRCWLYSCCWFPTRCCTNCFFGNTGGCVCAYMSTHEKTLNALQVHWRHNGRERQLRLANGDGYPNACVCQAQKHLHPLHPTSVHHHVENLP